MSRKAKGPAFKMRSGNETSFKEMGSSPMRGENIRDWRMVKKGGGDWKKVYRKPKGLATSRSGGQYFDDWGKPATYGMEEVDANLKKSTGKVKASKKMMQDIIRNRNEKMALYNDSSLSNLSADDFWSQYYF
tara:strand:+ start:212 stop:607 length:396 start_codon:yes stop_codon:yes gene_type:complete